MTKSELVMLLAEKYEDVLPEEDLVLAVDLIVNELTAALGDDRGVEIRGFGSFRNRHWQPRQGRNPKTGEAVALGERRIPYFTPGRELRETVAKS
ncbi:MAG: integration host factor subunit beta [Gammaproteobacteria bacterium]|nr:integration host factor subunit beta [Gammaproteobacteria bacterium]